MKKLLFVLLVFCLGCNTKKDTPVSVSLKGDSVLQVEGMSETILNEIDRNGLPGKWQMLLPVYRMPADTTLKSYQPVQPGTYKLAKGVVGFKPDTAFKKGQIYFVRYYFYNKNGSVWNMVKQNSARPGSHPYTDLIFRP